MDERKTINKVRGSYRARDGWWSRGYLPHFDAVGVSQFVTIRLADSLPTSVHNALEAELALLKQNQGSPTERLRRRQARLEQLLDAGYGACWLKSEDVALVVVASLTFLVNEGHSIFRWVIMPNHLHLLIAVRQGYELSSVMRRFKGYTAKEANKVLQRSGSFWFPEFFDRYIRDEQHYEDVIRYIDRNPVQAGLVKHEAQWRFSSAGTAKLLLR